MPANDASERSIRCGEAFAIGGQRRESGAGALGQREDGGKILARDRAGRRTSCRAALDQRALERGFKPRQAFEDLVER